MERYMLHCGRSFPSRPLSDEVGAASIAELLVVLAVNSILFILLLNGQEFVSGLAQRFFDTSVVESEARLLLEQIENDLARSVVLRQPEERHWLLVGSRGDTIDYRLKDSSLFREDIPLLRNGVHPEGFGLGIDTLGTLPQGDWADGGDDAYLRGTIQSAVRISFALSYKGKKIEVGALCPLRKRAPGT